MIQGDRRLMDRSPYSIAQFLKFAIEKENVIVLLNLRSLSFLFFIKHSIDICYEGEGSVVVQMWKGTRTPMTASSTTQAESQEVSSLSRLPPDLPNNANAKQIKRHHQEPIQSNSTSCPKHQTGKGHQQL